MSETDHFKHRAIRDLAWALLRPSFFRQLKEISDDWLCAPWQHNELVCWLYALDQKPEPLINHMKEQRATRLGIYFEQLLSFFFSHYPRFQLIARNLQVYDRENKRTLGEYDFIVFDKEKLCNYHIEVAVKFYIGLPELEIAIPNNIPFNNWHHWVGPNLKDTLAIKMRHLLEHQLIISRTTEGGQALHTLKGADKNEDVLPEIRLLLTGRLYLPWLESNNQSPQSVALPEQLNRLHRDTGHWLRLTQFVDHQQTFLPTNNTQYFILPRSLWMSAITPEDAVNFDLKPYSRESLVRLLTEQSHSLRQHYHIAECTTDTHWQEMRRFFVVS